MISRALDRLDALLSRAPVRVGLYALLIVLAILILSTLNTFPVLVDDAQFYRFHGLEMAEGNYDRFVNTIRTYGYPLFLAVCVRLSWLLNISDLDVTVAMQFVLHVVNAWVATRLLKSLIKDACRPWMILLVFALVVLNPYLLAMTTQILTDSVSVLCVTAFFTLLSYVYESRGFRMSIACGVMFGVCYVVRPFHLVWGIGLLGGALLLYGLILRAAPAYKRRLVLQQTVYMALAALLVILSQFAFTWVVQMPYGGTPMTAFQTVMNNSAVATHRLGAGYFYRYETYGTPAALAGGPTDRTIQSYSRVLKADPTHPQRFVMPIIKFISLFQQHDYPTYRPNAGLNSPTAFAVGLVLWCFYCYALPCALWEVWRAFRARRPAPLRSFIVYGLSLYVLLYAVPTIPEPRYIDPIYGVLTVVACVYALQEKRWWPLLLSVAVGLITYLVTAHMVLEFVLVGYPLFP